MFYWIRFTWGKARKQKHTYLLIELEKTDVFLLLRTSATGPRFRISKREEWGRKSFAFSWAFFFFMFSLLFVRTLCLFSHCFLSFYSSSSFCFADSISHLRFFFLLLFITLGLFFLSFFLTLSSTLCIIILGLFCFDLYALVDRGLFTFSLLFYCYYYLVSCCLMVLFDSFSILWGNVGRAGRWCGFWGTWKRYRIYSQYLYYDSTILDQQRL